LSPEIIGPEFFEKLFLSGTPFIDVRAPVEFIQGSLPGAVNIPILNDDERAQIGTTYKTQGQEAAISLGYRLVSGPIKEERLQAWRAFIERNPTAVLYCFRGGQRSQITQAWLREARVQRPLLAGGYKAARNFLMDKITSFTRGHEFLALSGFTGSGKTHLLEEVKNFYPTVHLEAIACHRGSAFGGREVRQPSQIDFENNLALALLLVANQLSQPRPLLVEDESRLIGKCILPGEFFARLTSSQAIWIDETLENRIENIFQDYILETPLIGDDEEQALAVFFKYKNAISAISKRLGGLRAKEIMDLLERARTDFVESRGLHLNKAWIEKVLIYYYDPLYSNLEKKKPKLIFKGSKSECLAYLKNLVNS